MRPLSNRLEARQFSLREASEITRVPEKWVRNYDTRKQLEIARDRFGKMEFSLGDLIRLKTMHELALKVKLGPADALAVGNFLVKEIIKRSRVDDDDGRPVFDESYMKVNLAVGLAYVGTDLRIIGEVAVSGPRFFEGPDWSMPHIVVPLAAIIHDLMFGVLSLQSESVA